MSEKSKRLGERGEDAAAAYLERIGMTVVERNWRCPSGEVDIVALDGNEIVLIEVKTRSSVAKGLPEEAITPTKQRRYRKIAAAYLQHAGTAEPGVRFDAITVLAVGDDRALLRHHRAAFALEAS